MPGRRAWHYSSLPSPPTSWDDLQLVKLSHPTRILASRSEHRAGQLQASRHRPAGRRNLGGGGSLGLSLETPTA